MFVTALVLGVLIAARPIGASDGCPPLCPPGAILETLSGAGIDGAGYDAALQARQAATLY